MQPAEFDPARFGRGEKHRLALEVDGGVALPVLLARGAAEGKTLVTSANVHGDEYEGVRAIFEIFDELDTAGMAGDWLAVPVVNPPAFWNGTRCSPVDEENLARVFPGDADGTISKKIAHYFGRCIIARGDFYLDLHSGGVNFRMPSMAGYWAEDPRGRAAAEIFGAPVIWGHPVIDPGRTVSFAKDCNVPFLYTEARGAGRIHPEDLEMMKSGIRNLLMHLSILQGMIAKNPPRMRLYGNGNTDTGLASTQRGFLINSVQILDRVRKGQVLGTLVNLTGEVLERYLSPADGIVGMTKEFPIVKPGESLFLIADEER